MFGGVRNHTRPWVFTLLIALFLSISFSGWTQESVKHEMLSREIIQAAMIIKFTDFITWPESAFNNSSEHEEAELEKGWFTIATVGDATYEGLFEPFTHRSFQNRSLRIVHYDKADSLEISDVQILIVGLTEREHVEMILEQTDGKPILTIGDFPGFAQQGGIINFFSKPNNRVGFEINRDSEKRSGLKISSHLLRLGKLVTSGSR